MESGQGRKGGIPRRASRLCSTKQDIIATRFFMVDQVRPEKEGPHRIKMASKYWQKTHKYGVRIPKLVKEALQIDKENGDTKWWDAIVQEMGANQP